MKPGGSFILVTYGNPKFREPILNKPKYCWKVEITTVGKKINTPPKNNKLQEKPKALVTGVLESDVHYVYIMIKGSPEPSLHK